MIDPHACANTDDVAWRPVEDCCDVEGAGPCAAGQGQCQTDDECRGSLYCGEGNCAEEWIAQGKIGSVGFDRNIVSSWNCCSGAEGLRC